MWAVRFWFGEFQEHHRQIERVRERETGGERRRAREKRGLVRKYLEALANTHRVAVSLSIMQP